MNILLSIFENCERISPIEELWLKFASIHGETSEKTQLSFAGALVALNYIGFIKFSKPDSSLSKKYAPKRTCYGGSLIQSYLR